MTKYIWQQSNWPKLTWDRQAITPLLVRARQKQNFLLGSTNMLGFDFRLQAQGIVLEREVIESSAIEGETLDPEGVRSSVARHLGLPTAGLRGPDRLTEGIIEVLLDATQHYNKPLTDNRLKAWNTALFPAGRSGLGTIATGAWRSEEMEIISGAIGRKKVHYLAPPPGNIENEMTFFLRWFNSKEHLFDEGLTRAALAHFWFVAIHPFDDGNGRLARVLTEMTLAQDEQTPTRFYSLSNQIMKERNDYYDVLERCSSGSGDITEWQEWFLACLERAIISSQELIQRILVKAKFWQEFSQLSLNQRQKKVINRLLDVGQGNFDGYLAAKNYRSLAKTTRATASRDIDDLLKKGILKLLKGGGRSTRYDLHWDKFAISPIR